MKVFRLEVIRHRASPNSSFKNLLRSERVGIFCAGKAPGFLYERIPRPTCDFPDFDGSNEKFFFGFPDTKIIEEVATELEDADSVVVAEYVVRPVFQSRDQVVFEEDTAEFVGETPFRDFLTSVWSGGRVGLTIWDNATP